MTTRCDYMDRKKSMGCVLDSGHSEVHYGPGLGKAYTLKDPEHEARRQVREVEALKMKEKTNA